MDYIKLTPPLKDEDIEKLKAGDRVLINGTMYTGRDAAHKKMVDLIEKSEPMPFDPTGQIIYFAGPAPTKPGQVINSVGPTTSGRMNKFSPTVIGVGLKGMVGKGEMGPEVVEAMKKHKAVYMVATGGAGALIADRITAVEIVAWEELGPEAVRRLTVKDFPAIVAQDCHGGNIFIEGVKKYRR